MKLLLLNDDGYNAFGIRALAECLCKDHDVTVVAPEIEQSACSHRITINRPIPYRLVQEKPYRIVAIDGSPADCARYGLLGLSDTFDLVISGINHGSNIGLDLIYSGTFSAAVEAALLGKKSIALSSPLYRPNAEKDFKAYVDWFKTFLEKEAHTLFEQSDKPIININFPLHLTTPVIAREAVLEKQHYVHCFNQDETSFLCTIKINEKAQNNRSDYATILHGMIAYSFHDIV